MPAPYTWGSFVKKLAVIACLALAPIALATPAHAETKSTPDPVDSSVAGVSDIRKVTVRNAPRRVEATIKLRRALPNKSSAYLIFRAKTTGAEFTVGNQAFGSRHETIFVRFTPGGDGSRVSCPSLKVRVDADTNRVRISFRQACLGRHAGPIRAAGFTETTGAHGQDADITRWLHVRRG